MKSPQFIIGTYQCDSDLTLLNIVRESFDSGIYAFDTAPSYKTEELLGRALMMAMQEYRITREQLFITDKIDAWQMRQNKGDVRSFVYNALKKLNTDYIDVMFIHWPIPEYIERTWESLLQCKEDGLICESGICNVRVRHLLEWKQLGFEPACIQIERHPLRTCNQEMEYCLENNIKVFSYSPLGRMLPAIRESDALQAIAAKYNKDIAQIILRWHLDTNACPVFTSTKAGRIKSNTNVSDFYLSLEEIKQVDSLNINHKIFLESWGCPGF